MSGDIAAFWRAQLDEKQAAAEAAARLPGKDWKADSQGKGRERDGVLWDEDFANIIAWFDGYIEATRHAALNDPRQALREVEAGRKLLAEYETATAAYRRALDAHARELKDRSATLAKLDIAAAVMKAWQQAVRLKAAVYRDHPDYRAEEWAP